MKERKKPDNLEQFFQQSLRDYEEDPGKDFWDKIVPIIPTKPLVVKSPIYKGWMLLASFLAGILLTTLFFSWRSNTTLIATLEKQVVKKNVIIKSLEKEIIQLRKTNIAKDNQLIAESADSKEEKVKKDKKSPDFFNQNSTSKKSEAILLTPRNKSFIKPEIARKKSVVAADFLPETSLLQPFYQSANYGFSAYEHLQNQLAPADRINSLLFDNQLITNSFFKGEFALFRESLNSNTKRLNEFVSIPSDKEFKVKFSKKYRLLDFKEKAFLSGVNSNKLPSKRTDDGLTSFIIASFNPISGLKYSLDGYQPNVTLREIAGIKSSVSWSVTGGFETKNNWSFQLGLDFNKLTLLKRSISNIRFIANEEEAVDGGYKFSLNQSVDGALGAVVVNSTLLNQIKNDGDDLVDGKLFQLEVTTEQPLRVVRMPVMGGYRFNLNKRWYITPKIGLSAVWNIKEQTQLGGVQTTNDRLSIQKSAIFLTSKITSESLEGILRAEFGYRWRSRWYLIAEPRFKYGRRSLFNYKKLALKDSPIQLMLGLRFNVD